LIGTTNNMIPVTKSFIPPIEEYAAQVNRAFKNEWLTNRGELVIELESKIEKYLGSSKPLICNNGTIPIQIALKLLASGGEVITTPFSYVATTSSIIWENCTPVFVDIDPDFLSIDEGKIEGAINSNTKAILATHVFGNPCHIEAIEKIAKKHNIAVIYDAAHCFGVDYRGQSIFNYGDVSTCSFHATKLFHTGEGGAFFCKNEALMHKLYYSHNFGHDGPLAFHGVGINGKISELQAAMGLTVLPYMDKIVAERKEIVDYYLQELNLSKCNVLKIREGTMWNYSYFPIILETEELLLRIIDTLKELSIFPRRYFYPSLNRLPYIKDQQDMPIAEKISRTIICLPLYVGLGKEDQKIIVDTINKTL
jgi:dTDP-4-amino-4,6-dideoxygalactose transaminase